MMTKVACVYTSAYRWMFGLLPPESFGAAMQYFTGSKGHNVALRQRALKMGYTLNEYSLAKLEDRARRWQGKAKKRFMRS